MKVFLLLFLPLLLSAARQVFILEKSVGPGGDQNISYCFWAAVAPGNETPAPGFVSAYRGATAAESALLQAGATVEACFKSQWPAAAIQATIQADLQVMWSSWNAGVQASANINQFYGANWDGAAWTAGAIVPGRLAKHQVASARGSGATAIVIAAGVAGRTTQIHRLFITCALAGTLQLKNGVSNLGPILDVAAGRPLLLEDLDNPLFQLGAGNDFAFTTSAAGVLCSVFSWHQRF